MYKILNISNYDGDLKKFEYNHSNMTKFLEKYNLDGFEMLQFNQWTEEQIPKDIIKGLHLRFYPTWIDFYRGDIDKLLSKIESEENISMLYGGNHKNVIIDYYKSELRTAKEIGVEYVVFHVCHVDLHEALTYEFSYSDEEIIHEAANLINEIFSEEEEYNFTLLLENLWWPGLKLQNKENMKSIIDKINYDKVGFMLDTGHMINTNLEIKDKDEAIEYIIETVHGLGEMKKFIKGIHLNYSLSGEYVKGFIENEKKVKSNHEFKELFKNIYDHISKIDYHDPFEHVRVNDLIESLDIKYLVYELLAPTLKELEEKIKRQDKWIK